MAQFSILVTIKVKPGEADKFRGIILENAAASLRNGVDCHKFDVLNYEDDPETFVFYEVYTNAASLDSHRNTPHFKKFVELSSDLIAERDVKRCQLIS